MNRLLAQLEKKPTYPVGMVNGNVCVDSDESSSDEEEEDRDVVNYEQNFVEAELKRYADTSSIQKDCRDDVSSYGCFSEVDGLELADHRNNSLAIYHTYNFKLNTDIKKELPIDFYKEKILTNIEINPVVVIEGPTGCGKTTQVPQLILDYLREKGQPANIVVTQPRKIATINVARRVCEERGWALGTVCGYQVGLEKKTSPDMILTYVTIGILLQKIIRSKHLNQYTHIIIDEVHERNQELDFLLLLVRKFLFTNSPHTKVILMSATFKANVFARYFRTHFEETIDAPVIRIEKKCQYSKTVFYLEQVMGYDQPTPKLDINKPDIPKVIWDRFSFLVNVFDKIENDAAAKGEPKRVGSVLVFLPGINEIEEADKILRSKREMKKGQSEWDIVPLHSSLPNDEQAKAFRPQRPGCRKIILSTNIAESSVTVPDSFYVIDFCLTKVMTVDPVTKYSSLKLEWASHVNCEQRAGRVGRTCDGRVYRLVPKDFYMEEMAKESTPEILRAPLDRVVLQAKLLELSDTPAQILALALNPPNLRSIDTTLWHLKEAGALLKTCRGLLSNADGDITFLGQVMASLPLDVHLAKLIVLGQLFSCLEETIIIAAGCSIQNIFSIRYQQRLDAYKKLLLWSDHSESDLITLLNLYNVWQRRKRDNAFDNHSEHQWCRLNMVNLKSLKEWNLLVAEIRTRLERVEIKETVGRDKVRLEMGEKAMTLKIVIAGAFYPHYFLKTSAPEQGHEREAVKTVGGRNPMTTVYFTGMDPRQPIQVYVRPLKKMLTDSGEGEEDIKIGDMDGSSKIFVECRHTTTTVSVMMDGHQRLTELPGRIPKKVYELIRKRQLNYEFNLKVLPYQKAWEFAERHGVKRLDTNAPVTYEDKNCYSSVNYNPIPSLELEYVRIQITQHIDAGHFWAQNSDTETNMYLSQIEEVLNNQQVLHSVIDLQEEIKMGKFYAAKYVEDGKFYRCKITALGGRTNQIIFIDYGNIQEVAADEIYALPNKPECHLAPLAFECVMYGIKPSIKENPSLVWTRRVNDIFKAWTEGIILYGEVYSVVSDVVHLELYRQEQGSESLNRILINRGFAEPCEEGYLSKQDHERRLAVQNSTNPSAEAVRMSIDKLVNYDDFAVPDSSEVEDTGKIIQLKGPFNPLEVKLYSCVDSGSSKGVVIDGSSVNCVLLDYEPESLHSRLVVAAHVGQSADGNRMRLRQTSVMPSIPGFPMLMALLFCPAMEPKVHKDLSTVSAILCGLGINENTGKPFYPAHDMILTLDTELTPDEIEKVNRLRYLMNNGTRLMQQMAKRMSSQDELVVTQRNIKKVLMELINMRRTIIPRTQVVIHGSPWGKELHSCQKLKPNTENAMEDIWPLLWFVRLGNAAVDNLETSKNLQMMMDMVYNVIPFENISCSLCGDPCHSLYTLRLHMLTDKHKSLIAKYQRSLDGSTSSESESDDDEN